MADTITHRMMMPVRLTVVDGKLVAAEVDPAWLANVTIDIMGARIDKDYNTGEEKRVDILLVRRGREIIDRIERPRVRG